MHCGPTCWLCMQQGFEGNIQQRPLQAVAGVAQVLCKAEHVHYTLWPVESYEEMRAISHDEFEDDAV